MADESTPVRLTFHVELPRSVAEMVEELNGIGKVLGISEDHLEVELESDSEFDLGWMVRDLEHSLYAITGEQIRLTPDRPADPPSPVGKAK